MRSQLLGYAALQQPARPASSLQEIADALNGDDDGRKSPNCTVTVPPSLSAGRPSSRFGVFALPTAGSSWFVSPSGSDAAAGTESAPFATIARAITASRASGGGGTVVLRAGTHYLLDTLALGVADSGLTLQAFPGEDAWVSGGIPLAGTNWVPWNVTDTWATHPGVVIDDGCGANCVVLAKTENASACAALIVSRGNTFSAYTWHSPSSSHGHANECVARNDSVWAPVSDSSSTSGRHTFSNVWAANLSAVDLRGGYVAGLRAGPSLRRLIRARYPNADPEFGFGPFLQSKSWTPPPAHALHPDIDYNPSVPNRTGQSRNFGTYKEGIGGGCAELLGGLAPPTGYWCSNTSEQTGMWRTPIGVDVDSESLPNQPYADPIGGVIQAWHPKRWASRMYNISSYSFSAAKGSGSFSFDRGGWQDARGSPDAGDFYVENVLEELDAPGEWFFMRNGTLLVYWNASGPPDSSVVAVSSSIRVLVNATGSQDAPVRNVSVLGLGFRDAAFSYFEEHSMPSAGDWTLARTAALFFEGSEATTIAGCVFERLDGCAVMASGYTRAANISDNEFAWVGDTAIALWGRTTGDPVGLDGPDGTDGNQPRGCLVSRNFAHELGIWEKQSSLLFQAKTSDTIAEGNIFFNGPRAAINLNDGFGGGNFISRNVLFNTCRESADHGPINSWDREVYKTYRGVIKANDTISYNFLLANYHAQDAVDNDDGSCYFSTHNNVMVYADNGMKSDYGGHDNHHFSNVYAYVGSAFGTVWQYPGHEDYFFDNHVVVTHDGDYGEAGGMCGGDGSPPIIYNNTIFSPTGNVTVCEYPLAVWQKMGHETGSSAHPFPNDNDLLGIMAQILV